MSHRVLCVDADGERLAATVEALRPALEGFDATFETATSVDAATGLLRRDTAAIVTEYSLPDGTGIDLLAAAREVCPDAGCILYTSADPEGIDTAALRDTVTEYVGRDSAFGRDRLARLLRTTIERGAQRSYPLPQNERERVAALRALDLGEDVLASLESITDLATAHFDVPHASINVIGEHTQEFLACRGAAEDWETMDREASICTFTMLEDSGVLVVEDVTEDPRFESRSETLVGMGIRSYMGANLATESGLVVGTLCVYDEVPRSFTDADRAYLRTLAALAMDLVEAHGRVEPAPDPEASR